MQGKYPVILGLKRNGHPTKIGLGFKNGAGYKLKILGLKDDIPETDIENCSREELRNILDGREYVTLHFCNEEAIDQMIHLLQKMKTL